MINIITNPLLLGIIQEVLDYQDLDYHEFTIPGLIKYSIYSSNSSIIGISILGELFLVLLIPIIKDPLYVVDKELQ